MDKMVDRFLINLHFDEPILILKFKDWTFKARSHYDNYNDNDKTVLKTYYR